MKWWLVTFRLWRCFVFRCRLVSGEVAICFICFICFYKVFCLHMQTGEKWGGYLFFQSFLRISFDLNRANLFQCGGGMSHKNCNVEFNETVNNYMMIKDAPDSDCWPSWRWSQPRCWPQWRRRRCQGLPTRLIDQKSLRCFWKTWRRKYNWTVCTIIYSKTNQTWFRTWEWRQSSG